MFCKIMLLLSGLTVACGCERRAEPPAQAIFAQEDCEYVVAVLVDLSPSFAPKMAEGGQAYEFLLGVMGKYFRDRIGTNDQLIIAQISGAPNQALLWQGTPQELRKDFQNSADFAAFLQSNADKSGSRVHGAIAQTVDYVMSHPSVASGKAKSAVFVLSDMIDTEKDSVERAVEALTKYGERGGIVGLFYVEQRLVPLWRMFLEPTGLAFSVEPGIRRPGLPSFE